MMATPRFLTEKDRASTLIEIKRMMLKGFVPANLSVLDDSLLWDVYLKANEWCDNNSKVEKQCGSDTLSMHTPAAAVVGVKPLDPHIAEAIAKAKIDVLTHLLKSSVQMQNTDVDAINNAFDKLRF